MNVERLNAAHYRAMSLAMKFASWHGTHHFFHAQAMDEMRHSDKIAHYLVRRNVMPLFEPLDAPIIPTIPELLPMFQAALALEQQTTANINRIYWQADADQDAGSIEFLAWFVDEQIRSEREYTSMIAETTRAQGNDAALLKLDHKYDCHCK